MWVGDDGVSPGVARALDQALAAHELVKVRMRAPENKRAAATELARVAGATLIHLIGHTVILFRANPDDPKIELPTRASRLIGTRPARPRRFRRDAPPLHCARCGRSTCAATP